MRSRRRGLAETLFLPLFLLRPYRCKRCNARHYGFLFRQRASAAPEVSEPPDQQAG